MDWNRILSGLLAATYVIAGFSVFGAEAASQTAIFAIFPLACIWYADAMGNFTGQSGSGYITETSPGVLVRVLGWLILLIPIFLAVYMTLTGSEVRDASRF